MDDSGVTLLGYTPIPTDASYTPPQHFEPPPPSQCMDTSVSPARTSAASLPIPMSIANMMGAGSPTSAFGGTHGIGSGDPPPYGTYSAVEPVVSSHYEPYGSNYTSNYSPGGRAQPQSCMTLGPYTPSQASSPAMSITGAEFDDFDISSLLSHSANPGPPSQAVHHMMEPMLPEAEPPNKIKKDGPTFSSFNTKSRYGGSQTMPHGDLKQPSKRGGRSKYSSRSNFPRATSPMFPDQSTPLSSICSLSRQPSISSLSTSSTSAPAKSVYSDPETYRYKIQTDSAIHSPVTSLLDSPQFNFMGPGGIDSPTPDSASRSCLEVEMPAKYSREIHKTDKEILKLLAKRSKLFEKAKSFGTGPMPHIGREDAIMELHWNGMDKPSDIGKVLLYIFPLGIREFDEPVYEEANAILRQVGGLYFDLQRALTNLREICCKGSILTPEISTCFAYIRSLLNINQRLKLTELTNGIYKIQLDLENGMSDSSVPHVQEFNIALNAANEVLMSAQHVTQVYPTMQLNLQQVKQRASDKVANFEQICGKLGIMGGERKSHIKTVLEGYSSAIEVAGQVRSIGCMVRCQQSIANGIKREMFQRKQNQAIQLISVHPLGAQMESFDPCSQQTISDANAAMMSSSGGMQQGRHLGGLKFHDAKMTPARRSWSLEGNLDIANHVIIRDEDKGKAQYSSHLHGLDVNESNQQRGSVRFSATASHILGRRLQIIATPTSASSTPPATSSSPTVNDIIKTDVDIQVPHNQPKQQCAHSSEVVTKEARGEEEDAGIPSQQIPSKTNYPDPKTDNNAFRERTDTANSAIFDISYDL